MTKPDYDFEACGDMQGSATTLPMLVVYDNPTDFAGKTVVRRSDVLLKKPVADIKIWATEVVFDTLLQARHWIRRTYPHLSCVARMPQDEPRIVETWL